MGHKKKVVVVEDSAPRRPQGLLVPVGAGIGAGTGLDSGRLWLRLAGPNAIL